MSGVGRAADRGKKKRKCVVSSPFERERWAEWRYVSSSSNALRAGRGGPRRRPGTRRRLSHPASLPYVRCGRLPLWLGFSSSHTRFHTDSFFHLTGVGWPSRGRSLYIDFFK